MESKITNEMSNKPTTNKIISDLSYFGLSDNQILGFLFHLGYTIDQYAMYIGVYKGSGSEASLMNQNPLSYLLEEDFEIEADLQSLDSNEIRCCYYSFAKVIHEIWVQDDKTLDAIINVGPQYLFTGEIHSEIWGTNEGKEFNGFNIDSGFLVFFESIGLALSTSNVIDYRECLWYGKDLWFGSALDDFRSYSYVVDKINTVMSPYLKMLLNYPIDVEINKTFFEENDLFTKIFGLASKLEDNKQMRNLSIEWQRKAMFDVDGNLYENYDINEQPLPNLLMQFAYDGFQFKYSLNSIENQEIYNAGNVLKLEQFEGKDVDLPTYASIIAQITHMQFGYDYRQNKWLNTGVYIQFLSFYFMLAMRYSVYPKDLID